MTLKTSSFWILTPESPLSWVSESFRQDSGQISLWKVFFVIKNIFVMKNLTDFRKTLEAGEDPRLENMLNSRKKWNISSS